MEKKYKLIRVSYKDWLHLKIESAKNNVGIGEFIGGLIKKAKP